MKSRANYYRYRTKRWFQEKGYCCEYLETYRKIYDKERKKAFFIRRDLFAADGISMNRDRIIFWNSKFGLPDVQETKINEGIEAFMKFPYPLCEHIERWLVLWKKRAREPEIIVIEESAII